MLNILQGMIQPTKLMTATHGS